MPSAPTVTVNEQKNQHTDTHAHAQFSPPTVFFQQRKFEAWMTNYNADGRAM